MYGGRALTVGDVTGPAGTRDRGPREPLISRQALHAALLGFTHPISEKRLRFPAPLPDDLRELIAMLREHRFKSAPRVAGTVVELP